MTLPSHTEPRAIAGITRVLDTVHIDEYTFRFNRRTSTHRGMLFMRLLQNAVKIEPTTYRQMIHNVRGRNPGNHNM